MGIYEPVPVWTKGEKLLASKFNAFSRIITKLTKRPAWGRIGSEFTTGGVGTSADPYIIDVNDPIDDLPDTGGVVFFPKGIYEFNKAIIIDKHIDLMSFGVGWGTTYIGTTLRLADGSNCNMVEMVDGVYFPSIRGLCLNGNKANQASGNGVVIKHANDTLFMNTIISDVKENALQIERGWNHYLEGVKLEFQDGCGIRIVGDPTKHLYGIYATSLRIVGDGPSIHCDHYYPDRPWEPNVKIVNGYFNNEADVHQILLEGTTDIQMDNITLYVTHPTPNAYDAIHIKKKDAVESHHIQLTNFYLINDSGHEARYGINILDESDYIDIIGYRSDGNEGTGNINIAAGANINGRLNRSDMNPFGVIVTPFDNTNHLVHINGGAAGPTVPNQDYTIATVGCRIISTGGTAVAIVIKDRAGNTISSPGATCDVWVEPGWKINFGNFSAAPTVLVAFK